MLSTKEMMWLVAGIVALLVIIFWRRRENMTNKDLMDTLSKFGEKGKEAKKNKKEDKHQLQIYGPRAEKGEPRPATDKSKTGADVEGVNVYPDIYGPELTPVPGKKVDRGVMNSDDGLSLDEPEFNPDLQNAFPGGGDPQPFLTDFSKFQH